MDVADFSAAEITFFYPSICIDIKQYKTSRQRIYWKPIQCEISVCKPL